MAGAAPAAAAFNVARDVPAAVGGLSSASSHDLYLSIFINGASRDIVIAVHEEVDGSLSIAADQLLNAGLLPDDAAKLPRGRMRWHGCPMSPMSSTSPSRRCSPPLPMRHALVLIIAADGSDPMALPDTAAPEGKSGMVGALLNNDLYGSASYDDGGAGIVTNPLAGSFEALAFGPFGLIDQTFSALSQPLQLRRLDTTLSYSNPDAMRHLSPIPSWSP